MTPPAPSADPTAQSVMAGAVDVLVIGAGQAGLAAGFYLHRM
ncbi:thioredoxin-disulfide reductase, partial [Micrococcus endophyticus]